MSEGPQVTWERETIEAMLAENMRDARSQRRWRNFFRLLKFIIVFAVLGMIGMAAMKPDALPWEHGKAALPHTAYITIRGEIAAGSLADADRLIPALNAAFKNTNAKAVVLRINSPGGSPVQSGRIYEEIQSLRDEHPSKKVYAVIDDVGASGGYYIAAAADEIYADRASLVGSIGVISSGFGFTGLMEKLGVERRAITSGENKALLDPFAPLTPEMKVFWEGVLSKTHEQFIARVRAGRGDRLKETPELFSGLLWNGEQALELGLIDGLGSLSSVARDVVGETSTIDYTPSEDVFRRLARGAKVELRTWLQDTNTVKVY